MTTETGEVIDLDLASVAAEVSAEVNMAIQKKLIEHVNSSRFAHLSPEEFTQATLKALAKLPSAQHIQLFVSQARRRGTTPENLFPPEHDKTESPLLPRARRPGIFRRLWEILY